MIYCADCSLMLNDPVNNINEQFVVSDERVSCYCAGYCVCTGRGLKKNNTAECLTQQTEKQKK